MKQVKRLAKRVSKLNRYLEKRGESKFWVDEVGLMSKSLELSREEEDRIFFGR